MKLDLQPCPKCGYHHLHGLQKVFERQGYVPSEIIINCKCNHIFRSAVVIIV
jgi:DNA-directed RNA polymerase subunit M/transcription elongation factor TFIIS